MVYCLKCIYHTKEGICKSHYQISQNFEKPERLYQLMCDKNENNNCKDYKYYFWRLWAKSKEIPC